MYLRVSPLGVEVLRLPVRHRHQGLVRPWQWRRRGAHGSPALWVGGGEEHWRDGRAVPSPRRARGGSVAGRQGLGLRLLLHGLHLVLLGAAPEGQGKGQGQNFCQKNKIRKNKGKEIWE